MSEMSIKEGTILWNPSESVKDEAEITKYIKWLDEKKGFSFETYDDVWKWSVNHIEVFWESIWEYFEVVSYTPYTSVLEEQSMPGANWFPGATLNYAEHILRNAEKNKTAIYSQSEMRPFSELSWDALIKKTAAVASYLRRAGVQRGDRVVAYMPNISETVIAFLATASIGAIWSSCAPEFGVGSTLGRFKQIEPKILFTVDGYHYNGKPFDKMETVKNLTENLPSVEHVVVVPYLDQDPDTSGLKHVTFWEAVLQTPGVLIFEPVPFDHPLWILYSSGTTGLPKAIVQGHGGILLTNLSGHGLLGNLTSKDRFFWYTTTGWMMWNAVVGTMVTGASIVLYDGSPSYPDLGVLWRLAEKTAMTSFGTSPSYILNCMKEGIEPGKTFDLSNLNTFSYTGAPLSPEGFQWVYDRVKKDIRMAPTSGGTDICAGNVGGSAILPTSAAEIPCRCPGVSVAA